MVSVHIEAAIIATRARSASLCEGADCSPASFSSCEKQRKDSRERQRSEQHSPGRPGGFISAPPGHPGGFISAPPLLHQGDAEARRTQRSCSTRSSLPSAARAAGMQPNPALPPTAAHRLRIPQGISSAACTALVVTPCILACHPAPVSLKMNGVPCPRAGRREGGCLLDCLQR